MATQNQQNQNHNPYDSDEDALEGDDFREVPRQRHRAPIHFEVERRQDDMRSWESGMRTKVPEFHEEFLDRLCITEEGVDEGLDKDYNYP